MNTKKHYSIRKHGYGLTLSVGNVDKDGNYVDDGSYKDLMTFRDIDAECAERVLVGLMIGNITIKNAL